MQSMVDRSQERQPPPRKDTSLVRQALGDHRRDTVAHRDAVEGVRDLHRALLEHNRNHMRVSIEILTFATTKGTPTESLRKNNGKSKKTSLELVHLNVSTKAHNILPCKVL